jgi:COMPASS component SWD1
MTRKVLIALLSSGEAFLIDTRPGQPYRTELWEKVEEPNPITVVRFHPHGKLVFAGTTMGHVIVFNTRTKQVGSDNFLFDLSK